MGTDDGGVQVTKDGGNIYLYSWGDSYLLGPGTVWSAITGTPTTLSGYGIVGTKAHFNTALSDNFCFGTSVTFNFRVTCLF